MGAGSQRQARCAAHLNEHVLRYLSGIHDLQSEDIFQIAVWRDTRQCATVSQDIDLHGCTQP